jgi:SagB-type dehydrogenase family enzyme
MPIEYVDLAAGHEAMEREQDLHSLPELFVENTRLRPHHAAGLRRRVRELAAPHWREVLRQSCKTYASSPRIGLPDPRTPCLAPSLDMVDGKPRPSQGDATHFSAAPLGAAELSRLLWYAGGQRAPADTPESHLAWTYPLPGDLNPIECYVVVTNSEGVPPGVYHFNADLRCLEALAPASPADLARRLDEIVADGTGTGGAAAAVVTTAVPIRVCALYGDRGYRMLLVEAGRIAERIDRGAAALGLHTRPVPNIYEDGVDRLLGIDGVDEFVVALCLVGHAEPEGTS